MMEKITGTAKSSTNPKHRSYYSQALVEAVFHVSDHFWTQENRCPKKVKNKFFPR